MLYASDDNASSSASAVSDVESADKFDDSNDDGSQRPSPSLYRQQKINENADATEDDDGEDNQSGSGSCQELCTDSEDHEERSESTPAAHSAAPVSQESEKFSEWTREFATLVEQNRELTLTFP